MARVVLIGLILTIALSTSSSTTVVRHPKFSTLVQDTIVDNDAWSPSYTTSVRGLDAGRNSKLQFHIDIEHLPDKQRFQMDMQITCQPSAKPLEVQYTQPFTFSGETFCNTIYPFKVETASSNWMTVDQQPKYSLVLAINRVPGADPAFQETFKHHVAIKFAFHNAQWRLESNAIYLWSWDSAFKWRDRITDGRSEPQYFLSSEALNLMLNLQLGSANAFHSIRFFEPQLMSLINAAPPYVRSYANIEAIMLLGVGYKDCFTHNAHLTLTFPTHKSGIFEAHDKMLKVAQVDSNGMLTFSRYGLSKAMIRFEAERRKEIRWDTPKLRICVGLDLSHFHSPVSSFKTVELIINPKLNYQTYGSLLDDCRIVGSSSKKVMLFARSGYNKITCPILCSNIEEPYRFFRGTLALTPIATFDSTPFLNDTISAFKAGNVIKLRDDLTYEDAGNYSCTAGKQTVTFEVSVVSLPYFTMRMISGKKLIGSLPSKVYAVEGEGYSVSCTVYFTGIQTPMLVPKFYLKSDGPGGNWTQHSLDGFIAKANTDEANCHAEMSKSSTEHSLSFTVTVRDVRRQRKSLFDHRLICHGQATAADAGLYGLPDYGLQSGADVHFVPRPRADSFEVVASDCCLKSSCNTPTEQCSVQIFLKREFLDFLTNIGVKVEVTFTSMQVSAPLSSSDASYDPSLAKVSIKAPGSLSSLPVKERNDFLAIRPVFRYLHVTDSQKEASFTVLRGIETMHRNDQVCQKNPSCLFSTDFDHQILRRLTVASIFRWQLEIRDQYGNVFYPLSPAANV